MNSYCDICHSNNRLKENDDGLTLCNICTTKMYDDRIRLRIISTQKELLKKQIEELDNQVDVINRIYKIKEH